MDEKRKLAFEIVNEEGGQVSDEELDLLQNKKKREVDAV